MDKSFGTLYNKLTNLFHSNTSTNTETNSSLHFSSIFDRIVPPQNNSSMNLNRNPSRMTRQISIKTNENRLIEPADLVKEEPVIGKQNIDDQKMLFVPGMNEEEFRRRGKEMIDYIADYLKNINERRVTPEVEPGYLRPMLPKYPPEKGEPWEDIMKDVEEAIMPGVTHWQHPRFHAYFPAGNSYPSILGEMLSAGLGIVGFSWAASPACTELETIMLDWIGRMIALPGDFLPFDPKHDNDDDDDDDDNDDSDDECSSSESAEGSSQQNLHDMSNGENSHEKKQSRHIGGGVVLGSASECILVAMLAARTKKITSKRQNDPYMEEGHILARLVCYTSKLAHSCVEKAGLIAMVRVRQLAVDEHFSLRGKTLDEAIQADKEKGLIPFLVSGTLGTTSCCSYDNLEEIGEICQREQLWFHVDGAYAGSALICEEYRYIMKGLQYADSFNTNPNKWLLMNFDCSCFWVRDKFALINAMSVDPLYLQHKHAQKAVDYRHWGVALSRRFRSLKLWFTIRSYGIEGLRHYIREHCRLAKVFASLISKDNRFEIIGDVTLGLVCFRLKGHNKLSQKLLLSLNDSGHIHMVPSMVNDIYIIRFAVCAKYANDDDMNVAYNIIREHADRVLVEHRAQRSGRQSSSNDSLDSAIKTPTTIPSTTQNMPIADENSHVNVPSETASVSPRNYSEKAISRWSKFTTRPHVTFEERNTNATRGIRPRPAFVRMVSDAGQPPKRTTSQLSRQSSLATPRARKRLPSDPSNHAARSSSEKYLSRTVSILETVNSDEGELDEKQTID